ncbi:hypothetical protein SAY87_022978 [Trapa incisa]|uniref:Pentatricopeptide repeat-containing protein n=1 Tax=Trapa incisa TaxID=236973 RepID=A0AAN7K9B3_9MYRT|nr:hypothetical protein SAY87_022978 [Trapa incisa]
MNQPAALATALFKNADNPALAWRLFKRILSSPVSPSSPSHHHDILRSVPIISRILIRAKMYPELDSLHQLLLSQPLQAPFSLAVSVIVLLARSGLVDQAVSQFKSLRDKFPEDPPRIHTYNVLIEMCLRKNSVDYVLWLYEDIAFARVELETYTFNLLMSALCDVGRVEDARDLFDKMPDKGCEPNEYSLGILVRGYCRERLSGKGLEFLNEMRSLGLMPNNVVYNTLVAGLCKEGNTDEAEKLVERMKDDGLPPDIVTFNSRISALCRTGKILEASRIFRDMQVDVYYGLPRPDIITYNLMLEGFYKEGMWEDAVALIDVMKKKGEFMNLESYNIWLLGLLRNGKLLEAQSVLNEMMKQGIEPSICTYNIVINGLCKNGMLSDAKRVINLMRNNGVSPDTITYTTIVQGYSSRGKVLQVSALLNEMTKNGSVPNVHTCNVLLHSLMKEGNIAEAEKLLRKMNEKGYGLDTVTCNILIVGLCLRGELDRAIEILNGMWIHGSAALGNMGNSFIALVGETNNHKKCVPNLITYSTVISALCKADRLEEAKKKFSEMMSRDLLPDAALYNIFIDSFCKKGKVSSAFRVLKDMEKRGCSKSLQTYNSLILGLGKKNQIFEIHGLMDEMKERGISPDVSTYNNFMSCLCEMGRIEDASALLDEMFQKGVSPNITTFRILIKSVCEAGDLVLAQEMFDISLSVCGHREPLYSLIFNELLVGDQMKEAEEMFKAALSRNLDLENFRYKDLIETLSKSGKLENASAILHMMIDKGYQFDPATFMPVIDELIRVGNKNDADELAEVMMEMASSDEGTAGKIDLKKRKLFEGRTDVPGKGSWHSIVHRDDGSGIAARTLKRVESGWGEGSILGMKKKTKDYLEHWDGYGVSIALWIRVLLLIPTELPKHQAESVKACGEGICILHTSKLAVLRQDSSGPDQLHHRANAGCLRIRGLLINSIDNRLEYLQWISMANH